MTKHLKKRKKRHFIKKLFFFFFFFFFFFTFSFSTLKKIRNQSNESFLRELLNDSNPFIEKEEPKSLFRKVTSFFSEIDFNHPVSLIEHFFHYKEKTSASDEESGTMSVYMKDPSPTIVDSPKVYIYNTHQLEGYNNENIKDPNVTPNVMMASYILKEVLLKKNIPSIVEEGNITEFLKINHWDYNSSYEASRYYLKDAMEKNPSLEYFIDVHRDSIKKEQSSVSINGVSYAKVLFVIGTDYETYQNNLEFTKELEQALKEKYPGISRGIITHGGRGYNGVYNQDLNSHVILLECGGYENTMDEVYHTMTAFAEVFSSLVGGKL